MNEDNDLTEIANLNPFQNAPSACSRGSVISMGTFRIKHRFFSKHCEFTCAVRKTSENKAWMLHLLTIYGNNMKREKKNNPPLLLLALQKYPPVPSKQTNIQGHPSLTIYFLNLTV